MEPVKIFLFISLFAIHTIALNTTSHVLSSRSDPSIRDRLPKIEMNATSHSIVMTLHPATINDGTIKRFRLQYGINFPYQHMIYINKNQTSVFVDKLEANQKYIFSLIALNENNDTVIPEQFYDFQMPSEDDDRQPPKTPLELNLIPRSKTSVLLQWTDVDYPKASHLPSSRRYKIQIHELDFNQQIVKQQELLSNEQSYLIENLKPLTNYEFAVRAIDGDLESDYSMAIEYSNAIYPIKQFNMITNNDPSKVTLTWQLPDDVNGIKSINIYYNEQGEKGQEQKITVPVELTQTTVSNLKSNTKYLFKIVSANQFNDESTPETRLYKTPNIIDTNNVEPIRNTSQPLFGWPSMGLANNTWLLIFVIICFVFLCLLVIGIMICLKNHCCSCLSPNKKHMHDSPTHLHQRQYSPTSNTASSSLIKPTDLWAGADCLSPTTATIRNCNTTGERHYETSSTAGSGTLQRCNHHHHHHPYHHAQETQPLTNNIELNIDPQRHSYVPSNDGSSSIDGNTSGFTTNPKFNASIRTRPIAVGGPFEQPTQKKSMKNLPMGTAFIMNHSNIAQQQHVTVRPIQQKAQYVVRPNEQPHSIGSGPSSPDYQHSPSNSQCSSNHNPSSNPMTGIGFYDKIPTSNNNNGENSDNHRALPSKPNLRSFTVPVAPPIIPPPSITNKQQAPIGPTASQYKSPFRSPNRPMLNTYTKEIKDEIDSNPADVLEDVRNQLGNLMKKDFQC